MRRGDFVAAIQVFAHSALSQRAPQLVAKTRQGIILGKSLNQHCLRRNRHAAEFHRKGAAIFQNFIQNRPADRQPMYLLAPGFRAGNNRQHGHVQFRRLIKMLAGTEGRGFAQEFFHPLPHIRIGTRHQCGAAAGIIGFSPQ